MEQAAQFLATKLGAARAGERARTAPKEAVPSLGPWDDDDGSMSIPPRPPSPLPPPKHDVVPANAQATKLLAMGFSSDMITEALKKTKTTEAAIEWILEESTCIMRGSAEALGTVQMCAPSTSEGHLSTFVGLGAAEPDDASSRRSSKASALSGCGGTSTPSGLPSSKSQAAGPGKRSSGRAARAVPVAPHVLLAHLVELGFTMVQATERWRISAPQLSKRWTGSLRTARCRLCVRVASLLGLLWESGADTNTDPCLTSRLAFPKLSCGRHRVR